MAMLRNALGEKDFDTAWAEGAALSEEPSAYAQRGRCEHKRSASGWASPTERDGPPSRPPPRCATNGHLFLVQALC
jgi:hypothetical protein